MSLLADLVDYLSTNGVGTGGTTLFASLLPDVPDAAVALFHTGGFPPFQAMGVGGVKSTAVAEHPTVQVRARDISPQAAEKKARDIFHLLDGLGPKTINGVEYKAVYALQQPFFLERDVGNREIYACNFRIVRQAVTSS